MSTFTATSYLNNSFYLNSLSLWKTKVCCCCFLLGHFCISHEGSFWVQALWLRKMKSCFPVVCIHPVLQRRFFWKTTASLFISIICSVCMFVLDLMKASLHPLFGHHYYQKQHKGQKDLVINDTLSCLPEQCNKTPQRRANTMSLST